MMSSSVMVNVGAFPVSSALWSAVGVRVCTTLAFEVTPQTPVPHFWLLTAFIVTDSVVVFLGMVKIRLSPVAYV